MKKFFIFDMDGTLCDSMGYWRAESSHIVDFEDRAAIEPIYGKMREHYRSDVRLKPGAREFLEKARAAGVKMCIATGTRRDVAQPLLEKTGLLELMEFYIDCYDVAAFKDKPDIYLKAAERLGAEVSECAVFEDSEYCAETADNAFDAIMNYNFFKVSYVPTTGRNVSLAREPGFKEFRCVGFYPIVSAEEALESNTSSAFPFKPSEIDLSLNNYELVYRMTTDRTMMPFYRFLIEKETDEELPEGMKIFKEYYLPAVSSEYLSDAKPQSETHEPLANPFTPYKGKEFVIDYDDLPFEYDGTNEPLVFDTKLERHSYSQIAYDVTELIGNNPWNESLKITELPVFANEPIAEEYVGQSYMTTFKEVLPQGYSLNMYDNPEMLIIAYEYLIEKYGGDLGITDYEYDISHDYDFDGNPSFDCEIYESSNNIFNAILNYNFSRTYFGCDYYNNEINIIYDNIAKKKAVGFYPVITPDEAREMLLNGEYSPDQIDYPLDSSRIKAVSLIYKQTPYYEYYMPYYEFYYEVDDSQKSSSTPEGLNEYDTFYIPAVSPDSYKDITEACDRATFISDYENIPAGAKGWVVRKWEYTLIDGSVKYDVKIEGSEQTIREVPAEYLEITEAEPRSVSTTS